MFHRGSCLVVLALVLAPFVACVAQPLSNAALARRQARSVHLTYAPLPPVARAARASTVVTLSQTNSYFMILGWDCGYCGIQDSVHYGRIFIFSVWDPGDRLNPEGDPNRVANDLRAKVLFADKGVAVARFGGEGTGARTITDIAWRVGERVEARLETAADGTNRTAYTCFVRKGSGNWRKIATISTLRAPKRSVGLTGLHSFVEDFWRNGVSATLARRAEFFAVAACGIAPDAPWQTATRAYFTGDATESLAVDAGRLATDRFFLQTGGATTNATTKLFDWVK